MPFWTPRIQSPATIYIVADYGWTVDYWIAKHEEMVLTRTMLKNVRHQKFAEAIVEGLSGTAAYCQAYPKTGAEAARRSASDLLTRPDVAAEIQRLRSAAASQPGYCVLTVAEKRDFIYRLVKARPNELDANSDLWQSVKRTKDGTEYKLPDKLKAIETDNDLAGEGSEAKGNEGLAELLKRLRK